MGFPAKQKIWTVLANSPLAGASLNVIQGLYNKGVADFLLAHGYTCKGSSDGVSAAMDGTNRWTTGALAGVRGATTATAQSWMVMTDASGVNILLAYTGGTDDIIRIGMSLGGLYVVAGTATFAPTATDELVLSSATTVINTTVASTTRIMFGWVDSTAKLCRFIITLTAAGTSSPVGMAWGVELFDSSLQQRTISPSVWGFAFGASTGELNFGAGGGIVGAFSQSLRGGSTRVNGQALNMNCLTDKFSVSFNPWGSINTDLQGVSGFPIWGPFRLGSQTTSWFGVVGTLFDWWSCRWDIGGVVSLAGDTYNALGFMAVGNLGGLMWPWDSSTTPAPGYVISAQAGTNAGSQNSDDPSYATMLETFSEYIPLAISSVTPTGPTSPKSIARRGGVDVIRLRTLSADPSAETGKTLMYTRVIAGQQALFCVYPDGSVYQVGAG